MNPLLTIDGVELRYGRRAVLTNASFELPAGSITALLGPNGAGKSTLMRAILGLHPLRHGRIDACGLDVARQAARVRAGVGYLPSEPDAYAWMTPRELYAFQRPQYASWSIERERALATDLHVPLDTRFAKLSRGQATKAMLVSALAFEPRLVLLDEPFGPLDPLMRDEIVRGVLAGLADEGCGVLVATHDLRIASRLADRVVLLDEGRVRAAGRVDEVLGIDEDEGALADRLRGRFDREADDGPEGSLAVAAVQSTPLARAARDSRAPRATRASPNTEAAHGSDDAASTDSQAPPL